MAKFNPKAKYTIVPRDISIEDFHKYQEEFVVRPPYQRKTVWSKKKQQGLLDSLLRRYYVPRIVIREVRLDEDRTVSEVVDGQQRITVVQRFYSDKLTLPNSLNDIHSGMPGAVYSQLPSDVRRFIDRLSFQADIVQGIDDPKNPAHQKVATSIFWRLQQGESLNYMEEAHSKLSSLARNFVVKYADDQRFDYEEYLPIDENTDKHPFFTIINRNNNRMQHLALLIRFIIIESEGQIVDIRNAEVEEFVDGTEVEDGIGNWSMEKQPSAKQVLSHLNEFYKVFKDDPIVQDGNSVKELSIEYFIISVYLLLRHLRTHYVFDDTERLIFREFVLNFHDRWRNSRNDSGQLDVLIFSNNRQQSAGETTVRDRIIRQQFFEFVREKGHEMLSKDERRAFSKAERISIYRRDNGLCQLCLEEGKPEKEALVEWSEYQADHVVPHSRGGATDLANAQVLCQYHNQSKGATFQQK